MGLPGLGLRLGSPCKDLMLEGQCWRWPCAHSALLADDRDHNSVCTTWWEDGLEVSTVPDRHLALGLAPKNCLQRGLTHSVPRPGSDNLAPQPGL